MCRARLFLAAFILIFGIYGLCPAEVPRVINYQGFLTDLGGTPVADGTYSIVFSIYDVPSGGSPLWSSLPQNVEVLGGMFSVQLGALPMPVLPVNIAADTSRYLGIKVGSDSEIAPRTQLTSTCYSFKSQSADTAAFVYNEATINKPGLVYGLYSNLTNQGAGVTYGIWSEVEAPNSTASCLGIVGQVFSDASERRAIVGIAQSITSSTGHSYGIEGYARNGYSAYGGYFYGSLANTNYGVYAKGSSYGVYGTCLVSNGNYGGYFYGNLHSTGTNTKGGGGFIIDHPADPENRYLSHFDVSSSELKNVYDGITVLGSDGKATVIMPEYIEDLNKDFRYQLTCIGEYAPVYIAEELNGNCFVIGGGKPYMKVSWQITGIRRDAFSKSIKTAIEYDKSPEDRGKYLHPEAFDLGVESSIDFIHHRNDMDQGNEIPRNEE